MNTQQIVLGSLDNFSEYIYLDLQTDRIKRLLIDVTSETDKPIINGVTAELDGRDVYFYRQNEDLHVRFDSKDFQLTPLTRIDIGQISQHKRQITIQNDGQIVFHWAYKISYDFPMSKDFTPFVEEEDFDICLLTYNVWNDPERRTRIWHGST
ncbi:MAG: hypothetical protein H6642_17530 [Caldilineaceae bacterium]|nr:hypothetical protein [Caldilineaceae bacterium]